MNFNREELIAAFNDHYKSTIPECNYNEAYQIELVGEIDTDMPTTGAMFIDDGFALVRTGDAVELEAWLAEDASYFLRLYNYNGDVESEEELEPVGIDEKDCIYFRSK
ncbi:MAG: hypothetical protein IKO65_02215 [Victivallales bacterium]|nr:hypothetical protein [Victivallales bacterium]